MIIMIVMMTIPSGSNNSSMATCVYVASSLLVHSLSTFYGGYHDRRPEHDPRRSCPLVAILFPKRSSPNDCVGVSEANFLFWLSWDRVLSSWVFWSVNPDERFFFIHLCVTSVSLFPPPPFALKVSKWGIIRLFYLLGSLFSPSYVFLSVHS